MLFVVSLSENSSAVTNDTQRLPWGLVGESARTKALLCMVQTITPGALLLLISSIVKMMSGITRLVKWMKEICQTADIDFDHWKHLNVKKTLANYIRMKRDFQNWWLVFQLHLKLIKWNDIRSPSDISLETDDDANEGKSLTPSSTLPFASSPSVLFGDKL